MTPARERFNKALSNANRHARTPAHEDFIALVDARYEELKSQTENTPNDLLVEHRAALKEVSDLRGMLLKAKNQRPA